MFIFDFEVFMYDWLVVFKDLQTNEYTTIINDSKKLKEFYTKNKEKIFFGYNSKSFDNIIFDSILSEVSPYSTMLLLFQDISPYIIYNKLKIKRNNINTFDLMQDILGMSLKEAEGCLGLSIEESSVGFHVEKPLTSEELKDVEKYCRHDVDATEQLLHARKSYVQNKMNICKLFKLPLSCLDKTNAALGAIILNAQSRSCPDEFTYELPPEIIITKYTSCFDLYINTTLNYKKNLKIDLAGCPHVLGYGGFHGALKNFEYHGEMWQIDAASYYPTIMIEYGYTSRALSNAADFVKLYHERIEAKRTGDKAKAEALKLTLNTAYGAMKSKHNKMYDPKMANQVCITGQLLFVDLIEKIEPYCKLVQSNTDGILIIPYDKDKLHEILNNWQKRTRIILEVEPCSGIWQKDVNNYVMTFDNGDIKAIGGYVTDIKPNRVNPIKHLGSARIVALAVVDYFIKGILPEETILKHEVLTDFQIITKSGNMYETTFWKHKDGDTKVNKVNRVYATKHKGYGNLYKTKVISDGTIRKDSIASLPENCYVDNDATMKIEYVDRDYYIKLTYQRIKDFKGEK